jgi:hypothetical protein
MTSDEIEEGGKSPDLKILTLKEKKEQHSGYGEQSQCAMFVITYYVDDRFCTWGPTSIYNVM